MSIFSPNKSLSEIFASNNLIKDISRCHRFPHFSYRPKFQHLKITSVCKFSAKNMMTFVRNYVLKDSGHPRFETFLRSDFVAYFSSRKIIVIGYKLCNFEEIVEFRCHLRISSNFKFTFFSKFCLQGMFKTGLGKCGEF